MFCLEFLKLLPLQGDRFASVITQGDALGCELLPFQGVWGKTCERSVFLLFKKEQIMIEDRSYGKAELAMLYFPTATPRVALNRLVRWINRCPELKQSLCSGYAGKFSHFYTRQQVAEIIEFLDEP